MQKIISSGGKFLSKSSFTKSSTIKNSQRLASTSTSKDLPQYLLKTAPYHQTTLNNQIRVATEENHGEVATIGVWIEAGSAYEEQKNNGVAHFLEHMAFKGTSRRTRTQLEQGIEDMGGSLNAYTSREQITFQAKVFKNDVPKAMDILSDILLHSKYDESSIEQERGTILREYEEISKDTQEVIFDHLHSAAFQGTSLGRTILGPQENIKSFTRDDLTNYVKKHYTGNRIVIAGAGAVKHDELVKLAEKHFNTVPTSDILTSSPNTIKDDTAKIPNSPYPSPITPQAYSPLGSKSVKKTPFTGSSLEVRDDAMEDVHFIVAVEGISASSPDYFAFMVFQNLIGSWERSIGGGKNLSSRLCEIIGTEELAHQMTCFNTVYRDTGLFGVYASCLPEKAEDLTFEILNEFTRLGKTVTSIEVERAKQRLKAALLMNVDGSAAVVEDIGRQLLTHGRRLTPAETILRINAVTVDDIKRISNKHCYDVEPCVVFMGNTRLYPEYHRVRGWTYWNRW